MARVYIAGSCEHERAEPVIKSLASLIRAAAASNPKALLGEGVLDPSAESVLFCFSSHVTCQLSYQPLEMYLPIGHMQPENGS
jgi:hypothetical protein